MSKKNKIRIEQLNIDQLSEIFILKDKLTEVLQNLSAPDGSVSKNSLTEDLRNEFEKFELIYNRLKLIIGNLESSDEDSIEGYLDKLEQIRLRLISLINEKDVEANLTTESSNTLLVLLEYLEGLQFSKNGIYCHFEKENGEVLEIPKGDLTFLRVKIIDE